MAVPAAYLSHLAAVAAQAATQGYAANLPGLVGRAWNIPPGYPSGTDLQNPAGFKTACDRTALNLACVEAYNAGFDSSTARTGVVMALKIAIDHQAAYERALHARHASPVRLRVWAGARRTGHGNTAAGVFANQRAYLETLIAAATATNQNPS